VCTNAASRARDGDPRFGARGIYRAGHARPACRLSHASVTAVDPRHTRSASGFNIVIARTCDFRATLVLTPALAATGFSLSTVIGIAMSIGAAICVAAPASAWLLRPPANTLVRWVNE
jgi:hypothetical protein